MRSLLLISALLFAYSHSVSAEIVRVGQSLTPTTWACIQPGMVVDTSSSICNGESSTNGSYRPISHISRSGFYLMIHFQSGSKMQAFRASRSACELPNTIVDGVCKDNFCSSSAWNNLVMQENESCAAKYPDHWTNLKSSCTDSKNYSFTCEQGIEKPDPDKPDPDKPDPDKPDPDKPDPDKPDPDKPDPDKPDPDKPDPDKPDPDKPDPDKPDPDKPDPDKPDPDVGNRPNPDYDNSGNAHGSGSSGGSASASDGNVSIDINFDGVHNRLDAVNDNLAGTNERIETTNDLLTDFANRFDKSADKTQRSLSDISNSLDVNGNYIKDGFGVANDLLGDIADGSNTTISGTCELDNFSCNGNEYECFVARQAWTNRCLVQSATQVNGDGSGVPVDSSEKVTVTGDALINDLKNYSSENLDPENLSDGEVSISDALSKFDESNALSFDERCPSPQVVDTGVGVMTLDYTPFCDLALYVRAMLMLTASIGSILMISKFS